MFDWNTGSKLNSPPCDNDFSSALLNASTCARAYDGEVFRKFDCTIARLEKRGISGDPRTITGMHYPVSSIIIKPSS